MRPYFKTENSTLYNGDCISIMEELFKVGVRVDKVITSPPYNISIRVGGAGSNIPQLGNDKFYDTYKDDRSNDEYCDWTVEVFKAYEKILNPNGCILYNMSYGSDHVGAGDCMNLAVADIIRNTGFVLADIIVWNKASAIPNASSPNKTTRICEFIYVFCREKEYLTFKTNKKVVSERDKTGQAMYENIYNLISAPNNDGANPLNGATFSTVLVDKLIDRYVSKDDTVLDSFSGTGTTMYACEMRGRKNIGIELSEAQCAYTKSRIEGGVQTSLF